MLRLIHQKIIISKQKENIAKSKYLKQLSFSVAEFDKFLNLNKNKA